MTRRKRRRLLTSDGRVKVTTNILPEVWDRAAVTAANAGITRNILIERLLVAAARGVR